MLHPFFLLYTKKGSTRMCERINLSNLPEHHVMVERLVTAYKGATYYEKLEGMQWYSDAYQYAIYLHVSYGLGRYTLRQMVELISVVSPGSKWEDVNMSLPEKLVSFHSAGISITDKSWPVYPSSILKAKQILDGNSGVLKGNKVRAFADAIDGDKNSVAIDGWMVKMLYDNPGLFWKNTAVTSDGMYNKMSDAVRDAAMFVGIAPALLQAVTWVAYRNQWAGKARRYRKNQAEKQFVEALAEKVKG